MSAFRQRHGGAAHTAASFTDLMASLMVVFVLLFVATVNNAQAKRQQLRGTLVETLRKELAASGLRPDAIRQDENDPYAIVLVMPQDLLFDTDSTRLKANGVAYLGRVAPTLVGVLCRDATRRSVQSVVVEGHTDTTFSGARPGDDPDRGRTYNLRLSQGRAMSVVETSLASLPDSAERNCYRQMVSASGRGQEEPLTQYSSEDPRQRRVVFRIRVHADVADALVRAADGGPSPQPTAR